MLETVARFSLLAFGIPGVAPDEHLSGTQPNDWSRHEPHQEKRCEGPPFSPLPHENTPVPARCNRLLRGRTGRKQSKSIEFCCGFRCGTFVILHIPRADRSCDRFHLPSGAHSSKKRASVKPHSVFLRKECILPERLDPLREPVGYNWTLVEEIAAPVLDTMIRQMGWHFEWVDRPCTGRGFGLTEEDAAQRALARALKGVARRVNAAELVSVQTTKYLGLHIANVTLQPRQIQQYTWLEIAENWHQFVVPVR